MFHAGVGDQLLRERLTTLEAKLNDPQVPSPRRKVLQNDVYDVQVQLGHSGLSVSDPVIVVEREYKKAAEARQAHDRVLQRLGSTWAWIWPPSVFGKLRLAASYLILATLLILAGAMARPNWLPAPLGKMEAKNGERW